MITIKKGGAVRICTQKAFNDKFKGQGYAVVEEVKEKPLEAIVELESYSKGGGWYEHEGKSYRKADLLEKLVD